MTTYVGCRGTEAQRFQRYVTYQYYGSGCHVWIGARDPHGYGRFGLQGGRGRPTRFAHRWSYEHRVGPIPDGLQLDHLCRNPPCINPDHLEPVTPAENNRRGFGLAARRARQTHCHKGHEFTPANTYRTPDGRHRRCRSCMRERESRRIRIRPSRRMTTDPSP